jgi:hypothetical protein
LIGADESSLRSDVDPATGGFNPVLGFASGGMYGKAEYLLGSKARVSVGFTQKTDDHSIIDPTYGPVLTEQLSPNRAFASVVAADYDVAQGIKLSASYTALREADGLLGSQGAGLFNMVQGTRTTATTVGATATLSGGWKIYGSATLADSTAPQFDNSAFSFTTPRLASTSYELVATKSGLFAERDRMRLSIAQPLHIESGAISYQSMQVVDRTTGELGPVAQTWSVSGRREYRMEANYTVPVFEGHGAVNGYGLVNLNPHTSTSGAPELAIGVQMRLGL